jgi:putative hemolysin
MKIILASAAVALLGLAACSPAAPPKPTEGAAQKAKVDSATLAYSNCISAGAKSIPVAGQAAGTLGDEVIAACTDKRNALLADVISFHQIGHPKFTIDQSKAVAQASIATIEDELRQQTVVTIVQRQTGTTEPAPTPAPAS